MSEPPALPKDIRRSTKWSYVGFVALMMLCVAVAFVWLVNAPTADPNWVARAQATQDVRWFNTAISAYLHEYGRAPSGTQSEILKTLMGENPRSIVFMEPSPKINLKDGRFLDPWGAPYKVEFLQNGFHWVYSTGKNKIDEGGHGDDIASWQ